MKWLDWHDPYLSETRHRLYVRGALVFIILQLAFISWLLMVSP